MRTEVQVLRIYIGDVVNSNPLSNYQARIRDRLDLHGWSNWIDPDRRNIFYFYNTSLSGSSLYVIQLKDIKTQEVFTVNNVAPVTGIKNPECSSLQFRCEQFKQEQFK